MSASLESSHRRSEAVAEFEAREQRRDARDVVTRLDAGLTILRNALFTRIQEDVESAFGQDSMLMPVSLMKAERQTKGEIELFQIAESTAEAGQSKYVVSPGWYQDWLARLRMAEVMQKPAAVQRLAAYQTRDDEARRMTFTNVLERVLPEARRAPLVLYKLFPLAVRLMTAVSFGDHLRAAELRNKQVALLPSIADCRECLGRPLDPDDQCRQCGNPLWTYDWLTSKE